MSAAVASASSAAELDQLCINTLRFLSVDAVQKANSGHPGLPLGAAPMAYVLWTRFLKHHPANPRWPDRDRFVLSAGHGSMLLYSLLHLTGYDLSLDDIKQFRQWGSKTPGHPGARPHAGRRSHHRPARPGLRQRRRHGDRRGAAGGALQPRRARVVDHRTYAIVSDGDLMEGVASEAASLAGHLQLGKLICLYDDNRVTLVGRHRHHVHRGSRASASRPTAGTRSRVDDGNDLAAIDAALQRRARRNRRARR